MRNKYWSQPEGIDHLHQMLSTAAPYMRKADYDGDFTYRFAPNTYNDGPSYELVVCYGGAEIFAAVYVIDTRFGDEVKNEEKGRVQNLLASYAMSIITATGLIYCIASAEEGELTTFVLEESRDKGFLSLQ